MCFIYLFSGNSESCRLLLKAGAKIDSVDKDGLTGNLLFFDLFSVYLKTIDHLSLKLLIFVGILLFLRFVFKKLRILGILNLHPCIHVFTSC